MWPRHTDAQVNADTVQVNEKSLSWIRENLVVCEEVIGTLTDFAIFLGFDGNEAVICDDEEATPFEPRGEVPLFSCPDPQMGEASVEIPVLRLFRGRRPGLRPCT